MAGNGTVLKQVTNGIGYAKAIENTFLEADFPEGVLQQISIDIPQVESVIASDIVHQISLTACEIAGFSVAPRAGKRIKKFVLELGGSDAFIVLNDIDMEKAATVATIQNVECRPGLYLCPAFLLQPKKGLMNLLLCLLKK
jgi:succinate-semialdehyde dehydrogenase/glutarate-semialdehyde dehydrogenase